MNELTEKQRYWKTHLEAAESFEGPLTDYAKLHDIDVKKLYVFKGVLEKKTGSDLPTPSPDGFIRVKTAPKEVSGSLTVTLPNGIQLSVDHWNAPGLLERLSQL